MNDGFSIERRDVVRKVALGIAGLCAAKASASHAAKGYLAALETELGGRIGVSVLDTANGRRVEHRGYESFAMCSTFKWLLAAAVLAKIDRGELSLADRLSFTRADLMSVSPVASAHVDAGAMTIDALSEAIIAVSDNTAANLLLARIGGPVALTEQLRRWGDDKTRLDRNEPSLNTNIVGDPRDTTTPAAMTALMQTILMGDALSNGSRDQLIRWLKNCRTGMSRIRAGIPRDWDAGDKTGTGANGAVNDLAILWPPNRAPILVAIYMSGSRVESEKLNAGHARIGEWVGRFAARG